MAGLPRNIIKKYGVTKKAWAIFRGSRSRSRSRTKLVRIKTGPTQGRWVSRRVRSVARRRGRSRGRGGGFGMGKLLSKKNLMYTIGAVLVGGAILKVDSKIAGAVGGFMGAGPVGAVAGYIAAPTIARMGGGLLGGVTNNTGYTLYGT